MISVSVSPCSILMRSGAQGKFDPSVYGTLLGAWYADTGITLDSGKVSSWATAFGTAGALAQASSGLQPIYGERSDGKKEVQCTDGRLLCGSLFAGSNIQAAPLSIIIAYGAASALDSSPAALMHTAGLASGLYQLVSYAGSNYVEARGFYGTSSYTRPLKGANRDIVIGVSYSTTDHHGVSSAGASVISGSHVAQSIGKLCVGNRDIAGSTALSLQDGVSAIWLFKEALSVSTLAAARNKLAELYPEIA